MSIARRIRTYARRTVFGFAAFLVVGNAAILGVHVWAQTTAEARPRTKPPRGVDNFQVVDHKLWRGSHPTRAGYRSLIEHGVETIVDLRAETTVSVPVRMLRRHGVRLVRIPIRDGQAPDADQVARFLDVMRHAKGTVYVHCMAGVGRTGTMVGAYLVEMKHESGLDALRENLSVGPPSLEQIVFVAGDLDQPSAWVTGISRVLDGPRRLWSYLS